MFSMFAKFTTFLTDEDGVTAIENGLIAALVGGSTVVGISLFTLVQVVGHWVLMQTGWVQP